MITINMKIMVMVINFIGNNEEAKKLIELCTKLKNQLAMCQRY